jgi:hypothetical protein
MLVSPGLVPLVVLDCNLFLSSHVAFSLVLSLFVLLFKLYIQTFLLLNEKYIMHVF